MKSKRNPSGYAPDAQKGCLYAKVQNFVFYSQVLPTPNGRSSKHYHTPELQIPCIPIVVRSNVTCQEHSDWYWHHIPEETQDIGSCGSSPGYQAVNREEASKFGCGEWHLGYREMENDTTSGFKSSQDSQDNYLHWTNMHWPAVKKNKDLPPRPNWYAGCLESVQQCAIEDTSYKSRMYRLIEWDMLFGLSLSFNLFKHQWKRWRIAKTHNPPSHCKRRCNGEGEGLAVWSNIGSR